MRARFHLVARFDPRRLFTLLATYRPKNSTQRSRNPMAESAQPARQRCAPDPSFAEFVAIISFTMGLMSLSIDNLLPAFGAIRASFGIVDANEMQLLISAYMVAFALMQIVYGPLSDVIGRRPSLMIGLAVYSIGTVIAILAPSYGLLLAARAIQGMGGAAIRVLVVAIVRDRYNGREMARVMSLIIMVFIVVPVFAPAIGSLFLWLGGWRLIFISMLVLAALVTTGFALRMPETLHPEYRLPFSMRRILDGALLTVTTRAALGYAGAMGLTMGMLFGYLNSSQQIFQTEVYGLGPLFPVAFGAIAAVLGAASFVNSQLVRRLGMRRLSHFGICGFILAAALLLGLAFLFAGRPPLVLFGPLLASSLFLMSLMMVNFNAMAMEPMGAIAGTASSIIGLFTSLVGALLGLAVGQAFDGTVIPLAAGFLLLGLVCLLVVLWTERGRLFRPHSADPAE
jgi:DHA1 family bicyclomycin/chloramphenicol resistance-like MFS transporter